MIIYEIDITIKNNIYSEYIIWLKNHIEEMLKFNGFESSNSYLYDANNLEKKILIHYYIKDKKYLNNYFNIHASKMQSNFPEHFQSNITIKRRVLEKIC